MFEVAQPLDCKPIHFGELMSKVMWSGKVNIGPMANIDKIKHSHGLISSTLFLSNSFILYKVVGLASNSYLINFYEPRSKVI